MTYGIQPTGYVRKPLSTILAELEAEMVTVFGPGVVQTPQSPLGQLNGLMADLLAEVDERNLDLYQSYDPDQAEGVRLDTLAQLRLISRGLQTDEQLRQAITNEGQGRVDIQDLARAIAGLPGVTYSRVFVNDSGETENPELERGFVAVAVMGGDDEDIALVMRRFIVPGVSTYGNQYVTASVEGFCRSLSVIRPVEVEVILSVTVRTFPDRNNCPPPSLAAVEAMIEQGWLEARSNGMDPSFYTIRSIVERQFSNVEVLTVQGIRDEITYGVNEPVPISFIEIAVLNANVESA